MPDTAEAEPQKLRNRRVQSLDLGLSNLFRRRKTDAVATGAPVDPPLAKFSGHLDGYDGKSFRGWAVSPATSAPAEVCVLYNGVVVSVITANLFRQDLLNAGFADGHVAFEHELDISKLLERGEGELQFVDKYTGDQLVDGCFPIQSPELKWSIEIVRDELMFGWVADIRNPTIQLNLKVTVDDREHIFPANLERQDLHAVGIEEYKHGFNLDISTLIEKDLSEVSVEVEHGGSHYQIFSQQVRSLQSKIEALTDLQHALRNNSVLQEQQQELLTRSILPALIDDVRLKRALPLADGTSSPDLKVDDEIAVIVPVYAGTEETIACLKSVLKSKNNTAFRLVVVDDCGPEKELIKEIERLNKNKEFKLFRNKSNQGFVKTVNRGMRYANTKDVVLLNSDTIVADGWLDALKADAYTSASIGTVTPMSNNATICSFPKFCSDNELPEGHDAQSLSEICKGFNSPPVELPTAHGFCMFIKRELINEIGYFDEQKWGKGYAEENDFSLRASRLGWTNVMTNKTFVHHLGAVSFSENSETFVAQNLHKLNGIYPDYPKLVEKFVATDPVRVLRKELAKALLVEESRDHSFSAPAKGRSILFVSLTIGGGTKVASDDLAERLSLESQSAFMLTTTGKDQWVVSSHKSEVVAEFDMDTERDEFYSFLRDLDIWHVHYHQVLEFNQKVWDIPGQLSCDYDVAIHDYYAICPRVNLVTSGDIHCGEPDEKECNSCLKEVGVHASSHLDLDDLGGSIESWRQYYGEKLSRARMVIAPSKDAKDRVVENLPLKNVRVKYHPEPSARVSIKTEQKSKQEAINIGFIGAIGEHKGLQAIRDLALEIDRHSLNTRITILGYTADDDFFSKFDFVTITGKYERSDLADLVKKNEVDLIFLASIWPETFSYTYSEVARLGLFALSYDLGAVPERSRKGGVKLIPATSTPAEIIHFATEVFSKKQNIIASTGENYRSILSDYYEISDDH